MDLLDGHVGLGGNVEVLGKDVNDDEDWVGRVSLDEFIDFQVGRAKLGTGVIPADNLFRGWPRGSGWLATQQVRRAIDSGKLPLIFLNISVMDSRKLWSKNQMDESLSSSSKGTIRCG